jgi:F0F1-type ATP synthase membrane subunit c/vacuolar-type H+-ATPase subunit K
MHPEEIQRIIALLGGIVVAVVSAKALKDDWKTPGLENHVFKLMLGLLCLGAVISFFAAIHVLGNFPGTNG